MSKPASEHTVQLTRMFSVSEGVGSVVGQGFNLCLSPEEKQKPLAVVTNIPEIATRVTSSILLTLQKHHQLVDMIEHDHVTKNVLPGRLGAGSLGRGFSVFHCTTWKAYYSNK